MISNFHTHSTFCDGKNTPEEIVASAIDKGFSSIGFSGHGYTDFDLRYCMKDVGGYIIEINRLKEKYKNKIQIYLGSEEDAFSPVDRSKYDYIIGSSHYFRVNDKYYPIDSGYEYFQKCMQAFDNDIIRMAEVYYSSFCRYINTRKPDIVGHFDLITKFDEIDSSLYLNNAKYDIIAEKYVAEVAKSGCIFEVNTGAISSGYRTTPYLRENLMHILKKLDTRIILSSDSHHINTLDFGFDDAKAWLKYVGFTHLYTLYNSEFVKYEI